MGHAATHGPHGVGDHRAEEPIAFLVHHPTVNRDRVDQP